MKTSTALMVCVDCIVMIANGNDDGMDEDRSEEVCAAIEALGGDVVCCGDDSNDAFSWAPCDCCGSYLGGSRHAAVILSTEVNS